jgi:hypothetical protein
MRDPVRTNSVRVRNRPKSRLPEEHDVDSGTTRKEADRFGSNLKHAKRNWGKLSKDCVCALAGLTDAYDLSVSAGHLQLLEGRWYITHSGLLWIAYRRRCSAIKTVVQDRLSDPLANRWVFRAIVYKSSSSKGFVGYGDADPSNCSNLVHGAEMRVAETRAVNRALRKAYGIGLCSVEELGAFSRSPNSSNDHREFARPQPQNGSNNGQPRLRDQLCLLIRQYNLDPTLVKAYAADFCGTETLSGASRDLVESFIAHLAVAARENRDALVCKLNSYAQPQEAKS